MDKVGNITEHAVRDLTWPFFINDWANATVGASPCHAAYELSRARCILWDPEVVKGAFGHTRDVRMPYMRQGDREPRWCQPT